MDKYEFSLKMEQMKKLIGEEDYQTALKITESIDWNRVRNTNLLTMAAAVFEKNDRLNESKEVLKLALDRAPVGKRILYKLTELAVRTGDLDEAEDYYYEYRQVDSSDIGNYVLQYMILKAKHAPYDRQLQPLELYCEADPDEKWLYELAVTYEYAGRIDDCIKVCDRIALLYGSSSYSIRALRLKMRHAELTAEQKNLLYPRSVPEYGNTYADEGIEKDGFGYGEDGYGENAGHTDRHEAETPAQERDLYTEYGLMDEPGIESVTALDQEPAEEYEDLKAGSEAALRNSEALAMSRYPDEDAKFEAYARELEVKAAEEERLREESARPVIGLSRAEMSGDAADDTAEEYGAHEDGANEDISMDEADPDEEGTQMAFDFGNGGEPKIVEDEANAAEAVTEAVGGAAALTAEASAAAASAAASEAAETVDTLSAAAEDLAKAGAAEPVLASPVKQAQADNSAPETVRKASEGTVKAKAAAAGTADRPEKPVSSRKYNMIVEANTVKEGVKIAIDELKRIHEENGIKHASVKTSAVKLNEIGFTEAVMNKIKGGDIVIENAGSLDADLIEELYAFIKTDKTGAIVVMVDTPDGLDNIENVRPELFDICDYVSDIDDDSDMPEGEHDARYTEDDEASDASADGGYEDDIDDEHYDDFEEDNEDDEDDDDEEEDRRPSKRSSGKVKEKFTNIKAVEPVSDEEQMEIDDFARYCAQYASSIDCSITGKSMLALYERIELMEEDGIGLTKKNAENLIEEAADKAEKPPIGKRIAGVFHSKYDKNGCLILKEDDFL